MKTDKHSNPLTQTGPILEAGKFRLSSYGMKSVSPIT